MQLSFVDESNYLREWIEFHLMVGVDRFVLYDNGSEDNSREILDPYVAGGIVTLLPWAGFGQTRISLPMLMLQEIARLGGSPS